MWFELIPGKKKREHREGDSGGEENVNFKRSLKNLKKEKKKDNEQIIVSKSKN